MVRYEQVRTFFYSTDSQEAKSESSLSQLSAQELVIAGARIFMVLKYQKQNITRNKVLDCSHNPFSQLFTESHDVVLKLNSVLDNEKGTFLITCNINMKH